MNPDMKRNFACPPSRSKDRNVGRAVAALRPGINNQAFGDDLAGYATGLAARWRARGKAA
jgi:hypothetical protein